MTQLVLYVYMHVKAFCEDTLEMMPTAADTPHVMHLRLKHVLIFGFYFHV